MKTKVNGVKRDPTPIEWVAAYAIAGVVVFGIGIASLVALLLLLAIRLIAYAVPLALALVIAYHVARYAGVEFSYEPAVAKGVDR